MRSCLQVMLEAGDDGVLREEGAAVHRVVSHLGHIRRAIAMDRPWAVDGEDHRLRSKDNAWIEGEDLYQKVYR